MTSSEPPHVSHDGGSTLAAPPAETGFSAELRVAHTELADAIGAIQAIPGFESFLAPVRFAEVAAVAAHPLVYLVASERSGLALVVHDGTVTEVRLPELTDRRVHDWAEKHRATVPAARSRSRSAAARGAWTRHLAGLTDWLWDAVGGPLLAELPLTSAAGPEQRRITLVPAGLTAMLPVHAARRTDATRPSGHRYLIDEVVPAYTPNARALAAARDLAATVVPRRLLAVTDPEAADLRLPHARWEGAAAAAAFADNEILVGAEATFEGVRAKLPATDVAHFGCHGVADPEPLQSAVRLAGGASLRLADVLPMRLRLRLAVLSACDTFVPGRTLPDEVINLPTGLLQAGVAGVVASMWAIDDHATAVLMTEFYHRWMPALDPSAGPSPADPAAGGHPVDPAVALAGAQRWLRDATPADVEDRWAAALEAGEPWLPEEVAAALLPGVFAAGDATDRPWRDPALWAAFTFTGA
ncbi:CHAT domain-containing protein [Actinoplanes sp. DH11]|uniref:CHAT domain-containing protein n=1 Tax=Actinoplanes sp. DH11 TaxID=2857011 RepID=UPI001E585073|nr:CHAT domain-containing protein [Actinoplanes sp. DH11]